MGIGIWELVLLLLIVLLLFGTKRLRNIGGDLGSAIKSFRSAVNASEEAPVSPPDAKENDASKTETTSKDP